MFFFFWLFKPILCGKIFRKWQRVNCVDCIFASYAQTLRVNAIWHFNECEWDTRCRLSYEQIDRIIDVYHLNRSHDGLYQIDRSVVGDGDRIDFVLLFRSFWSMWSGADGAVVCFVFQLAARNYELHQGSMWNCVRADNISVDILCRLCGHQMDRLANNAKQVKIHRPCGWTQWHLKLNSDWFSFFSLSSLWGPVNVVLFNTVIFLLAMAHLKAVFCDPGMVPLPRTRLDFSDLHARKNSYDEDEEWTVCTRCETYRPPRAHHCRICKRCIRRMDHHCKSWLKIEIQSKWIIASGRRSRVSLQVHGLTIALGNGIKNTFYSSSFTLAFCRFIPWY